ncbi:hypothetical protein L1887_58790 [Cichorium endivia]|nr:hypothetical protein L1887_58790 [Cichorium endivia]
MGDARWTISRTDCYGTGSGKKYTQKKKQVSVQIKSTTGYCSSSLSSALPLFNGHFFFTTATAAASFFVALVAAGLLFGTLRFVLVALALQPVVALRDLLFCAVLSHESVFELAKLLPASLVHDLIRMARFRQRLCAVQIRTGVR